MFRAFAASWKTTAVAIFVFVGVVAKVAVAALDNDPATVADFNLVIESAMALLIALGLLSARDADRSSQDSGLRP